MFLLAGKEWLFDSFSSTNSGGMGYLIDKSGKPIISVIDYGGKELDENGELERSQSMDIRSICLGSSGTKPFDIRSTERFNVQLLTLETFVECYIGATMELAIRNHPFVRKI